MAKSWRDILPIHPAAELFPLMSEDELRALGEDIRKHGLHEGIVIFDGKLLDGRNRLDAMELVGIKLVVGNKVSIPLTRDIDDDLLNDDGELDPYAYVISANIHRRHLTAEQKRELIETLLKATPDKSDRQIAATVKVDHKTVASVRAETEARGEIPHVETRTDSRGREQQAHKPKKKSGHDVPADIRNFQELMREDEPSPANEIDEADDDRTDELIHFQAQHEARRISREIAWVLTKFKMKEEQFQFAFLDILFWNVRNFCRVQRELEKLTPQQAETIARLDHLAVQVDRAFIEALRDHRKDHAVEEQHHVEPS